MTVETLEAPVVEDLPVEVVAEEEAPAGDEHVSETEQVEQAEQEAGELVVTLGDEQNDEDERKAPEWVKDLRKQNRELVRKTRELESRLQQSQPAQTIQVGPRPALKDFEWDEDAYSAALDKWHERKAAADAQQREAENKQRAEAEAWQKRLGEYETEKRALRIPGIEQAEEAVKDVFSAAQLSLMVHACKKPALMVAALGNNDRKARELAAIKDPMLFVAELVRTEMQVKTAARKPATPPERTPPRSSVSGAAAVDDQLAKLQAQAAKTGDRTPVVRYLRQKERG